MFRRSPLEQYGNVQHDARAEFATAHAKTLLLFDGAIDYIGVFTIGAALSIYFFEAILGIDTVFGAGFCFKILASRDWDILAGAVWETTWGLATAITGAEATTGAGAALIEYDF